MLVVMLLARRNKKRKTEKENQQTLSSKQERQRYLQIHLKKDLLTGFNVAPKALPTSAIVPYQAPEAEEEGGEKRKRKNQKRKIF